MMKIKVFENPWLWGTVKTLVFHAVHKLTKTNFKKKPKPIGMLCIKIKQKDRLYHCTHLFKKIPWVSLNEIVFSTSTAN